VVKKEGRKPGRGSRASRNLGHFLQWSLVFEFNTTGGHLPNGKVANQAGKSRS